MIDIHRIWAKVDLCPLGAVFYFRACHLNAWGIEIRSFVLTLAAMKVDCFWFGWHVEGWNHHRRAYRGYCTSHRVKNSRLAYKVNWFVEFTRFHWRSTIAQSWHDCAILDRQHSWPSSFCKHLSGRKWRHLPIKNPLPFVKSHRILNSYITTRVDISHTLHEFCSDFISCFHFLSNIISFTISNPPLSLSFSLYLSWSFRLLPSHLFLVSRVAFIIGLHVPSAFLIRPRYVSLPIWTKNVPCSQFNSYIFSPQFLNMSMCTTHSNPRSPVLLVHAMYNVVYYEICCYTYKKQNDFRTNIRKTTKKYAQGLHHSYLYHSSTLQHIFFLSLQIHMIAWNTLYGWWNFIHLKRNLKKQIPAPRRQQSPSLSILSYKLCYPSK